jgi:hypothetical protein
MAFTYDPAVVLRDFVVDGDPGSGKHLPPKPDMRGMLGEIQGRIAAEVRQVDPGNRIYVSTAGDDGNDGSSGGSGAKLTVQAAADFLRSGFDFKGTPPSIFIENGFTGAGLEWQGHPVGYHFAYLEGESPGAVTLTPPAGGLASIIVGDYAALIPKNIEVASTGSGQFGFFMHQHAILDLFEGCEIGGFPGGVGIANDHGAAVVNLADDLVVSGSMSELVRMTAGGVMTAAGGKSIVMVGNPTFFNLFNANAAGSNLIFGGGRAVTGACTITGRALQCSPGSFISKGGNSFPSAASPDGGGGTIV